MLHTRAAEISHADVKIRDGDRMLLLTLAFMDNSEKAVTYRFKESTHGNEILVKLLKGAGYTEEKRLDRLFADLIGARVRARIDDEGALCGVGHRMKNTFYMWDDQPVYPVEASDE
jgi:ribosomal protein S18 acetylase RimI-like enzyme